MERPKDLDPYASTDEWKFKNRTAEQFARYAKELEARIERVALRFDCFGQMLSIHYLHNREAPADDCPACHPNGVAHEIRLGTSILRGEET
jgi:hypothetical protein